MRILHNRCRSAQMRSGEYRQGNNKQGGGKIEKERRLQRYMGVGEGNEKCSSRERKENLNAKGIVSVLIKSESGRRTRKIERESDGVWREGLKNGT